MQNNFKKLSNQGDFIIASSCKEEGNMSFVYGEKYIVQTSGNNFIRRVGANPQRTYVAHLTHSCNIAVLDIIDDIQITETYTKDPIVHFDIEGYYDGFDGYLSTNKDLYIAILTGDCIPLVIWEHQSNLHGIIHVGLLGLINGIYENFPKVYNRLGIDVSLVNYYIEPSITYLNYNIANSRVWNVIDKETRRIRPEIEQYLLTKGSGIYIDMQSMLRDALVRIGANPKLIQAHSECVASDTKRL